MNRTLTFQNGIQIKARSFISLKQISMRILSELSLSFDRLDDWETLNAATRFAANVSKNCAFTKKKQHLEE